MASGTYQEGRSLLSRDAIVRSVHAGSWTEREDARGALAVLGVVVAFSLSSTLVKRAESPGPVWPATVGVSQISISTELNPLAVAWTPPEVTRARVSIFGFGFAPGAPVTTKWNNAFGFPDNGVGANSIKL